MGQTLAIRSVFSKLYDELAFEWQSIELVKGFLKHIQTLNHSLKCDLQVCQTNVSMFHYEKILF